MEEELFFSGYCRQLDSSRTVCVLIENGRINETDCAYPACPHAPNCPIAIRLDPYK